MSVGLHGKIQLPFEYMKSSLVKSDKIDVIHEDLTKFTITLKILIGLSKAAAKTVDKSKHLVYFK
jgi:hypothetical protein